MTEWHYGNTALWQYGTTAIRRRSLSHKLSICYSKVCEGLYGIFIMNI